MIPPVRFWSKVDGKSPFLGCWTWLSCTNQNGYGVYSVKGQALLAHRLAWTYLRGSIPDKACVLHRCDNPRCVNPAHLFLGTQADNVHDMDAKSRRRWRAPYGEAHPNAKLTIAKVRHIHSMRASGIAQQDIANAVGVTQCTVSSVLRGATWKHALSERMT